MNELVFHLAMIALVGSVTAVQVTGAQRQTRDDVRATFDVASVKTNKNGQGPFRIGFEGGTFTATNVTVRQLVAMAFGAERSLPAYQLVGGPNWIDSDRFDIVAKGMAGARQGANLSMLQALLKERFGLVVHSATQSLPSYALTVARKDRKLGPELVRTSVDCAASKAARGNRPPVPAESRPRCGFVFAPGYIIGGAVTLPEFAAALSRPSRADKTVVDRTGLKERFNLKLRWTPEQMPRLIPGGPPPGAPPLPDPNGPSIFTALQEQLGLKLESTRGPVDVLVIDRVERPTPD
jgi:bla regulator protein blaR1